MRFEVERVTIEHAMVEAENEEEFKIRLKYGLPDYIPWREVSREVRPATNTDNGTPENKG